ncbi:MAG: dipeptidyl peptidase 3 [Candidatus Amulumruptor caecigallinarius]|nr:dipeptidyl peptidase 3 [Candidatus Amulumruptor caecigallinarius]MCM1396219.1 dipeptidyl peptidase 3 [Candidatus Amulumruptor caecigallinarius]MCM1453781.1 dipeptidyl peptidase 3 [bacterium]
MAATTDEAPRAASTPFDYTVDRFADIEVLRYKVPGFEALTPKQKALIYYLTEAALSGRDIVWDQYGKHNLAVRRLIEKLYTGAKASGDTSADFKALEKYLKQIEFANGIHHHYSMDKFTPEFTEAYFDGLVASSNPDVAPEELTVIKRILFEPSFMAKRVNQADGQDLIMTSANNLYEEGLTQPEVEAYYASLRDTTDLTPVSIGLNSRLAKDASGKVVEQTYRQGGLYDAAITRIIDNLTKASALAENDRQKQVIDTLIDYYRTGDLKKFDEYSILWVGDTDSRVDFINGFIESYGDPLGLTGTWESIVNFKNLDASHRTEAISGSAQWFEDHSPVDPRFRKPEVKGVTAKVITAAILAGDAYPATPIGINLPNANWIRAAHGSKSVTLENITEAYDEASHGNGFNAEFVIDEPTSELLDKYLFITDNLHTDLHECLGHASGRLLPGVDENALGAYGSCLEETRADLFALYYLADPKLIELGLLDNPDAYKAEYYKYMLNGLMTQLMRIEPGKDIEEAHMRNRALVARWALEKGKDANVVEMVKRDGKTFVKINDYEALRGLFAQLLAEIQRVKSEGDFEAGRALVETYGVKVDPELHKEVLDRYAKLNIAPYKGFVNPVYTPVMDADGNITDVTIDYTEEYLPQVLRYSRDYSTLK